MLTEVNPLWYSEAKLYRSTKRKTGNNMADTSVKQQIVDKLKDSSNILVTVNSDPSVDELSAALGITLLLNKLNKHATAVFSGAVPPAIEFLNPEKTFENTVDSLRDFIIALDKEKADHLRYKVVDDMVKIFITPYRTTISQADLDFSQGDYNVETVLAIGVKTEEDLDKALESHGRILHDATVATVSLDGQSNLGGLEWVDTKASSYGEMLVSLAEALKSDKNLIDEQIATAFLTGIVAATDRFSNEKTSASVMTMAAQLMAAGANQQLIATKLQEDDAISAPATAGSSEGELKEGESTKLATGSSSSQDAKEADGAGALSISHVPAGNVDEVAAAVAAEEQADATEAAEQKLAEQLGAASGGSGAPSATDLLQGDSLPPVAAGPLRGPVAMDQWRSSRTDDQAPEPTLGGTLNATTEQAEDDKRRQLEDDRNRTILSHGGSTYAASAPAFQAPLNSTVDQPEEPEVKDIFAEGSATDVTAHAEAIQPPAPVVNGPTLAEIDAQNRATHTEAMDAVQAALESTPSSTAPAAAPALPPDLPPLPPMPDFSTLPPLPGVTPEAPAAPALDTLGDILPPAAPSPEPGAMESNDPAQFRIPGQN
jgi:nanoRNase/pAp phosphatase (c-di-AMP/oligoRNAs hydrolase)